MNTQKHSTLKTISVKALRELLEDQDDDALVVFAADYGDYSHTEQALPIKGEIEEVELTRTAYSHSGFAIGDGSQDDIDEDYEPYLVIR